VTIKPALFRDFGEIFTTSGLGLIFVSSGQLASVRKWFIKLLYKSAISPKNTQLIFQNETDCSTLQNMVNADVSNVHLIMDSGVNLDEYKYTKESVGGRVVVCLEARLLKEKGVYEFVEAARMIDEMS
jgi:hypothetical protein